MVDRGDRGLTCLRSSTSLSCLNLVDAAALETHFSSISEIDWLATVGYLNASDVLEKIPTLDTSIA